MPPFVIARVPVICESVEVAIHDGFPFCNVRTRPSVEEARVVKLVEEFAYKISPDVYDVMLVPPCATVAFPVRLVNATPSDVVAIHDGLPVV